MQFEFSAPCCEQQVSQLPVGLIRLTTAVANWEVGDLVMNTSAGTTVNLRTGFESAGTFRSEARGVALKAGEQVTITV